MAAPIRRHTEADAQVELKAWRMTFKSGYDFLRALPKIGVDIGPRHQPARDAIEAEWRRLGRAYLDARDRDAPIAWAQREFGLPEDAAPPPRRSPARSTSVPRGTGGRRR